MKIVRFIGEKIYTFYMNIRFKNSISYNCHIGRKSFFEGRNRVSSGSQIYSSQVGKATYITRNCYFYKTKIGRYCSIGNDVKILWHNHPTSFVSTHPLFYNSGLKFSGLTFKSTNDFQEEKLVSEDYICIIEDDVWIGDNVSIMGGVTIGTGAVLGAGCIVTKDVPPFAIVAGVPAKILRYRFSNSQIELLLKSKWWNQNEEWLKNNNKYFSNVEDFLEIL